MSIKKKKSVYIKNTVSFILCAAATFIILGPLYWMIVTSFKMESEIYQIPPPLVPDQITSTNYAYVLNNTNIVQYFFNSFIYAVGTLVIVLACVCLAAYAISRHKFTGKAAFLIIILLTQLMPLTTLIVPLYINFAKLQLLNNRWAIIAVYAAIQIPVALWLLIGYFNGIPKEIDEAAIIDGCTKLQVLGKIIIPLAKPGLMSVSLSIIISVWQELMLAMTFTNVDSLRPLMAGVSAALTKNGIKWGQINATGIIALLPLVLIYIFLQKYLIKGLTGGAVKG